MEEKKPQFFILLILVSLGTVGGVLFTPALPTISTYFGVTSNVAQLTMTAFLFTYAVGQLPYGPISNRVGRKNAVYIGALISSLGALLSFFSPYLGGIYTLIFARLLMGLGSAVGLKMAFTIVSDVYTSQKATKINSHLVSAFAIMPGISAAIGGFLTTHVGWESTFLFLSFYSLGVIWLASQLPETLKQRDPEALKAKNIVKAYRKAIKNPPLVLASFIIGIGTSYIYLFATKGPFLATKYLGITAGQYGFYYLISLSGMLTGSLVSGWLSHSLSLMKSILTGVIIALLGAIGMVITWTVHMTYILELFAPLFFIFLGMAISYGNCISLGLAKAHNKANGSALISFINIGMAFLTVLGLEFIPNSSPLATALVYLALAFTNIILWFALYRNDRKT